MEISVAYPMMPHSHLVKCHTTMASNGDGDGDGDVPMGLAEVHRDQVGISSDWAWDVSMRWEGWL